jgi:hypothetical protein
MLLNMFSTLSKFFIAASFAAFLSGPTLAADEIGEVVAVVGSPSASGPAGTRALKKDSAVFEDDTIIVKTGNAQIILKDGTRLVVGPSSRLLLDQFVMTEKSKAERVAIKGLRGTYRFITGRSPKSAYKISTAHGTIGIRGTGFDFWSRDKTGAAVLRGKITLKSASGPKIDINSGCQIGEATKGSARLLTSREKASTAKKNFPFLLDQSVLTSRFRLNVVTCRLTPDISGPSNSPQAEPEQQIRFQITD